MRSRPLPKRLKQLVSRIKSKRARRLVELIEEKGQVSTEELREQHDYVHPPRAARDVREAGIPLKTVWVKSKQGRRIGAYELADLSAVTGRKLGGR